MYLHTQTVLYTLWVGCTHTYLCMYVQTHPDKQLRLVRGKNFVFLFSGVRCYSAGCCSESSPSAWHESEVHSCNKARNTGISTHQQAQENPLTSQIFSRVWQVMRNSTKPEQREERTESRNKTHGWRPGRWRWDTHCQIVAEQLHDQGAVFVGVTLDTIQFGNGVIKGLEERC